MCHLLLLLLAVTLVASKTEHSHSNETCDGFQATFDLKEVLGTWHVVAIIPDKLFPEKSVTCYRVEFSEADEGGVRWLISKTKPNSQKKNLSGDIPFITGAETLRHEQHNHTTIAPKRTTRDGAKRHGTKKPSTIVRLRFHTQKPFDVWSKSVSGVNGCFSQILVLEVGSNETHDSKSYDGMMQLHLVHTEDGPYLLQLLWGRMISAVIYRQKPGVIQDQLKPVFLVIEQLRGPQRLPRICENSIQDLLFTPKNNTLPVV